MLPVTHGEPTTRWQILIYSLILVPLALTPTLTGLGGPIYLAVAAFGGAGFIGLAVRLLMRKDRADAKRLFGFSILYLFLLFAAVLGEHVAGVRALALLR
jgi:protoheme IX farnesyltransferase